MWRSVPALTPRGSVRVLIVGRYQGIIGNRSTDPIHLERALQTDTPASTEALRRITPL